MDGRSPIQPTKRREEPNIGPPARYISPQGMGGWGVRKGETAHWPCAPFPTLLPLS
jgi:hypothetical protein